MSIGNMVSSPKSSAKKKGSAAKSAVKTVSNRSAFRYGSKMVQMCAENVITRHVDGAKNPTLAAKWLQKMKLSILRKVSACSKVAFLSDGTCPTIRPFLSSCFVESLVFECCECSLAQVLYALLYLHANWYLSFASYLLSKSSSTTKHFEGGNREGEGDRRREEGEGD